MTSSPADTSVLNWTLTRRLGYAIYQLLMHLALPLLIAVALLRSRREPEYARRLGERFGGAPRLEQGAIAVAAASLGEVRAATPLVRELLARGQRVVMTPSSPAGYHEVNRQFAAEITSGTVSVCWIPIDLFWAVNRFLKRLRPRMVLVVESETWPGLIAQTNAAGIPISKVNANLTELALERDLNSKVFGRLRLWFLSGYSRVLTKSERHRERYVKAGVDEGRINIVGELKFDQAIRDDLVDKAKRLKATSLSDRPVLMIASSIREEEDRLLQIVKDLHNQLTPAPFVLWVPRSPQRFDAVFDMLRDSGFSAERRSAAFDSGFTQLSDLKDMDCLVGDSLGEMDFYYALSDVVFVGATLHPMGGHNANEPFALNKPVVTGPSVYGIPSPADEARECGALRVFETAEELSRYLVDLFGNPTALMEFAARTHGLIDGHKGAAKRSADALGVVHV